MTKIVDLLLTCLAFPAQPYTAIFGKESDSSSFPTSYRKQPPFLYFFHFLFALLILAKCYSTGGENLPPVGDYVYVFWHPRAAEKELTGRNFGNTGIMEALSESLAFWSEQYFTWQHFNGTENLAGFRGNPFYSKARDGLLPILLPVRNPRMHCSM